MGSGDNIVTEELKIYACMVICEASKNHCTVMWF